MRQLSSKQQEKLMEDLLVLHDIQEVELREVGEDENFVEGNQ